jgi:hypothetical protein
MLLLVASAAAAEEVKKTFGPTEEQQEFVVPDGVMTLTVEATGASGGVGIGGSKGGAGAYVSGDLSVLPGQKLYVEVGGQGKVGSTAAVAAGRAGMVMVVAAAVPLTSAPSQAQNRNRLNRA